MKQKLITILGPTATGKTELAANLAAISSGEIISADSRQVFRQMDIGTGKDLKEYIVNGRQIPYHLIDIRDAGSEYSLFDFQKDFLNAFNQIVSNGHLPILCGGTTLYLDSILKEYELIHVPEDFQLEPNILEMETSDLVIFLGSKKESHNTTDSIDRNRILKALRIAIYAEKNPNQLLKFPEMEKIVFGIHLPADQIKQKITTRLKSRLKEGMIEEVEALLKQGVSLDMLKYYGLEYKFLALFLNNEINYNDLFQKLNSAIQAFAKKQMTKYRSMEKNGIQIKWIDGNLSLEEKLLFIRNESGLLNG